MKIWVLVIYQNGTFEVDTFHTEAAAENAFMRDLYECFQDHDLPAAYDELIIAAWLSSIGESYDWTITETELES